MPTWTPPAGTVTPAGQHPTPAQVFFAEPPREIGPVLSATTDHFRFPHALGRLLWLLFLLNLAHGVMSLGAYFTYRAWVPAATSDSLETISLAAWLPTALLFYLCSTRTLIFIGRDGLARYQRDLFGRVDSGSRLAFSQAVQVKDHTTRTIRRSGTTTHRSVSWVDAQGKTLFHVDGNEVQDAAIEAFLAYKQRRCADCGQMLASEHKFCTHCGRRL